MPGPRQRAISTALLDALIEEATVDCYNDSEQVTGLFTMIEEHLVLPFQATVLGVPVTVARVDVTTDDQIVALCTRDEHRHTILILGLPVPDPAPDGWEWVEAYRADAEPVVIGARRRPEAVVLSYERYLKLLGGRERVAAALEQQAREAGETLDAEAAMELANSELHAMRRERRAAKR
jgi:hypothetical protein